MSNAFTRYINYYSIAGIKGGVFILVALQAKYSKIQPIKENKRLG